MESANALFDVVVLLLAAVAVVPVLQRLGVPSVLGYLAAGIMVGPYTPGPVVPVEQTRPLAEFGVVFLLFAIGLELPLSRLRAMRRYVLGLGLPQVVITAAILSILAHYVAGLTVGAALIVGATLAFSSTAAVLALLVERGEAASHHGRIAVAVLVLQDLAVVPVLALLPLLAGDSRDMLGALVLAAGRAVLAVAAIYGGGRLLIHPIYRWLAETRNAEVLTAANLLLVLAVAWLTQEAGMSMALGAFLAGLLLADSPYRHQVEGDIEPFRGLLLGLFFMTVGMSINLPLVLAQAGPLLAVTAGLLVVKATVLAGLCLILRLSWGQGLRVGLLLAQTGEFAFVVFARAGSIGLLSGDLTQLLLAAVALSMVLTPALAALGRVINQSWARRAGRSLAPTDIGDKRGHVIIAGFGRVGQAVARLLAQHGVAYVAVDLDPDKVAHLRREGWPVYYGDGSQLSVMRSLGMDRARTAVITLNHPKIVEKTVSRLRQAVPGLTVIARAHDLAQRQILAGAGATAVVPETIEASLQLAGLALRAGGLSDEEVDRSLQSHRQDHYRRINGEELAAR